MQMKPNPCLQNPTMIDYYGHADPICARHCEHIERTTCVWRTEVPAEGQSPAQNHRWTVQEAFGGRRGPPKPCTGAQINIRAGPAVGRCGSFFAGPVWAINAYDVCLTRVCTALSTTPCVRCRSVQKVPYCTCVVYEPSHRYKWDERL